MSAPVTALLLHSFGSAGRSWSAVRERLEAPSVAPDLPGFGEAPPLPHASVGAYADWVLAKMAEIGGAVVLVGASMGGKIAMAAAARRPAGLRGLVLCAPSPPTAEPMEAGERARQLSSWRDASAAVTSTSDSTLASRDSKRFDHAVEDWLHTSQPAWRWWWENGSREDIDVAAVASPVTVVVGDDDDRLGAVVQLRETIPRLTRAELQRVPGSKHLLAIDRPEAVAGAISAMIESG